MLNLLMYNFCAIKINRIRPENVGIEVSISDTTKPRGLDLRERAIASGWSYQHVWVLNSCS